jgi:hypothetical protein
MVKIQILTLIIFSYKTRGIFIKFVYIMVETISNKTIKIEWNLVNPFNKNKI